MRLQGAIFDGAELLCASSGKGKPGVSEFLSLLKMDGVGMYLLTAGERRGAAEVLCRAGLQDCFRGILSAVEERGDWIEMQEKAVRRLRSPKGAVLVFTADLAKIPALHAAGFRIVAVTEGQELAADLRQMAEDCIGDFAELICRQSAF